jgi:hypothetical protein
MKLSNPKYAMAILAIFLFFSCKKSTNTNSGWIELGGTNTSTFNNSISSIIIDASGNIYAGGYFTNGNGKEYVAKWNGNSWIELGGTNISAFNSWISSITTDAQGNVYAAGNFTNDDRNRYVAKWNGTAWSELGVQIPPLLIVPF